MHLPNQARSVERTTPAYQPGGVGPDGFFDSIGSFFTETLPGAASTVWNIAKPIVSPIVKPLIDGTFVERDPAVLKWAPLAIIGIFLVRGLGLK